MTKGLYGNAHMDRVWSHHAWMMAIASMLMSLVDASGQTNAVTVEQRMRQVIVPSIEFRQASPIDVLHFLVEASTASDPDDGQSHGIGLIRTNAPSPAATVTYELEDGSVLDLPPLTVAYRRISLLDALDRVTSQIGLTYQFEGDRLVFRTKDGKRLVRKHILDSAGR